MPIEILMPALSPTMKEGNLAKWLKKEGDKIKAGEVIAEIETDKATMEVEAVDEGILGKIIVASGTDNVAVNSVIALILDAGEDKKALDSYVIKSAAPKVDVASKAAEAQKAQAPQSSQSEVRAVTNSSDARLKASPLAKRIAAENNVALGAVVGSGPHGRIVRDDILQFVQSGGSKSGVVRRNAEEFKLVKNSNIRKIIAKRLSESKQTIPHFYLSCEVKLDKLMELRAALNEVATIKADGHPEYKVSVNDLVIKASALALKKVPHANSSWTDEALMVYNNVDIAVAVAIDDGLVTPIVRNADQKTVQAISQEMKQLAKKAKEGKLQPEEFQGGGFSISNLGMYGIDNFSAIVNPPQSCILAVGAAVQKPIVDHGQIKIAHVMNVTISCDHRCVDGAVGAEFMKALRRYIEHPILMVI